jgi:hypothetical protein
LLLQFKVPQVINRRSSLMPDGFAPPYYRVHLRCRRNDDGYSQHSILLEHERNGYDVFYAAPRFHQIATMDEHFTQGSVLESSAFFAPSDVGDLSDSPHHVAYCAESAIGWLRSNPVKLPRSIAGPDFLRRIQDSLDKRERHRFRYRELLDSMVTASERGIARTAETDQEGIRRRRRNRGQGRHGGSNMPMVVGRPPEFEVVERRRMPPREFAARLEANRSIKRAAALFARLWLNAELLEVTP